MTTIDGLDFERENEIAILTINRTDRGNALGAGVHDRLNDVYAEIKADKSIRAIVLTGAGDRFFCSGQDLRETAEAGGPGQRQRASIQSPTIRDVQAVQRASPIRHDIWLPFIVAVNGACAGSGFHFVADADIVVASQNATFIDTHCAVGQVSVLEPLNLLHRVSVGELLRLVVLGRAGKIDAETAQRIGLVTDVVPVGAARERAVELAHAASRNAPSAVESSKRAIWAAAREPMRPYFQYGWDLLRAQWSHPDSAEGPRAFIEKRDPHWVA